MTTTGTWRKGDRLTARWVQRVSNFIENFTVSGGAFEFDGRTPRLEIKASGAAADSPNPFGYTITQGVAGVSHASVTIGRGVLVYHLPDDISNADRYYYDSDVDGSIGYSITANGYHVIFGEWDIDSVNYSGVSSGLVINTTPKTHATDQQVALQTINSDSDTLRFPILGVYYNSTTRQITETWSFNANKIYSVVPVAGIGP